MADLILKSGNDRSVLRRHPWIFAGSVDRLEGRARAGDTVLVMDSRGKPLARAAWSPESQIRARVWSFDPEQSIDHAFIKRAVAASVARRASHPWLAGQDGVRLIHGESDGLPGVTPARSGAMVVVQPTSARADKWRDAIVAGLVQATGCSAVYERSDSDVRKLEGLGPVTGLVYGEMPESLTIVENGVRMEVDVAGGHKTGFYLDQRENRQLTGRLAAGRDVLNCFCYTGGFSLAALAGGGKKGSSLDPPRPPPAPAAGHPGLHLIIPDPPKSAPPAAHAERAARAYKDINLLGLRLLNPGGILMTYSCSGGIGLEMFQKIVASAASDVGIDARILHRLSAAPDHPVGLAVPEGEYLKGLACQV